MFQYAVIILLILAISIAAIFSYWYLEDKKNALYENTILDGVLPQPAITGNSVELSLNSRVSYHEGYKGRTSDEWLSNVLWAAGRSPTTGAYRNIFVTLPDGKYQYDALNHSLSNRTSGSSGKAAFVLDYDRERDFDAGVSYMFALLGSVSMWNVSVVTISLYDVNQDGLVNQIDRDIVWNSISTNIYCQRCDINKDNMVEIYDWVMVSQNSG